MKDKYTQMILDLIVGRDYSDVEEELNGMYEVVRVLKKGSKIGCDHNPNRLNIRLSKEGVITSCSIG